MNECDWIQTTDFITDKSDYYGVPIHKGSFGRIVEDQEEKVLVDFGFAIHACSKESVKLVKGIP